MIRTTRLTTNLAANKVSMHLSSEWIMKNSCKTISIRMAAVRVKNKQSLFNRICKRTTSHSLIKTKEAIRKTCHSTPLRTSGIINQMHPANTPYTASMESSLQLQIKYLQIITSKVSTLEINTWTKALLRIATTVTST
jgi:hypothetical protein